ncbi:MAG: hypothetical protein AAGD22_18340 [Verrucomicrobiota bacterium]
MKTDELEVMNVMPFLFWAKNKEGRYLWGNRAIDDFAGCEVAGKMDCELPWADTADALVENDASVLASGKPSYIHELVHQSAKGEATLNVCKFPGELDGIECTFGVSFVIEE